MQLSDAKPFFGNFGQGVADAVESVAYRGDSRRVSRIGALRRKLSAGRASGAHRKIRVIGLLLQSMACASVSSCLY